MRRVFVDIWSLLFALLAIAAGCSGDGDKSGNDPQPAGSVGNSASATVDSGIAAWTADAVSLTKNDNDGAMACSPAAEKISTSELAERTYERASGRIIQKVHCKSDIIVQLTAPQKQELETALAQLKIITIKGSDASTCSTTSGFLNSWTIASSNAAGPQTYFTNPTSTCGDIKVLRGTETVNALLEKHLRASGKL